MATYSKIPLSGSVDGRMILVTTTATSGTVVHTATVAGSATNGFDVVWLWAQNNHTADVLLTINYGGSTSPNDLVKYTVPFQAGLKIVLPGLLIRNSLVISAYAATPNVVSLSGFVDRGV